MGWQPIKTAPQDGTVLLVYWLHQIKLAWWNVELGNWQEWPDGDFEDIRGEELTHWTPLPGSP
jgi:hypothetical protein